MSDDLQPRERTLDPTTWTQLERDRLRQYFEILQEWDTAWAARQTAWGCEPDSYHPPDPVHRHIDGSWWFYDETWADEIGPYDHEDEAHLLLRLYGHWLETGQLLRIGEG